MKRIILVLVCVVGMAAISSCRSTAPCGLSQNVKQIQQENSTDIIVAEVAEQ